MKRTRSVLVPSPTLLASDNEALTSADEGAALSSAAQLSQTLWRVRPNNATLNALRCPPPVPLTSEPIRRDPIVPLLSPNHPRLPASLPRVAERIHIDIIRGNDSYNKPEAARLFTAPSSSATSSSTSSAQAGRVVLEPVPLTVNVSDDTPSLFPRLSQFALPFGNAALFTSAAALNSTSFLTSAFTFNPQPVSSVLGGLDESSHSSFQLPALDSELVSATPSVSVAYNALPPEVVLALTEPPKRVRRGSNQTVRRPSSPFVLYSRAHRGTLHRAHEALSFDELTRLLAAQWNGMAAEARAPYEQIAREDALRYYSDKERQRLALSRANASDSNNAPQPYE